MPSLDAAFRIGELEEEKLSLKQQQVRVLSVALCPGFDVDIRLLFVVNTSL
jgi:hypothetical protein